MSDEREFTRPGRGARMQLLIGEAIEAAQTGQTAPPIRGSDVQIGEMEGEAITYNDYFNDSSDAGSYVQSSEEEDYVDSDFMTEDEDGDEDEDEGETDIREQEKSEKKQAKKKGAYQDPAKRAMRAAKAPAESDSDSEGGKSASARSRKQPRTEGASGGRADRSFRSSTKERSEISKESAKVAAQVKQESAKNRPAVEERRLTQEELLQEAKLTAIENEKDLQRLVRIEEDMKKVVWNKAALTGPRIVWHSTKDIQTVTWTEPSTMPPAFTQQHVPAGNKPKCVITGLPAMYRDPLSGHPYAHQNAFKKLRDQYAKQLAASQQ
mmetsp:Transcript_43395/g.106157  ORF Transcript_43395/g.106157 Transcript_43395/m.106157 type:complete len:323 (-) Transcript_43395:79-1047(-)